VRPSCAQKLLLWEKGDHMVLFQEFPWNSLDPSIPNLWSSVNMTNEKMVEVIQGKLGTKLLGLHRSSPE